MASTFVYIVRHAQTAENLRGIIQGQLDTQLDATGRLEQAPAIAHALKDVPFDVCFTSDLKRAVETAEEILRHHPSLELHKLSLLRERVGFMGNLQGQAAFPGPRDRRPPLDETVESTTTFVARTLQFWDELILPRLRENTGSSNMLVVSHGSFISTMARALVGHRDIVKDEGVALSWCPNVSITLVEVQLDGTGTLRSFGDISHMAKHVAQGNVDELIE